MKKTMLGINGKEVNRAKRKKDSNYITKLKEMAALYYCQVVKCYWLVPVFLNVS
nr:hypothetical protein Itr_chr02CG21400 [Ipomoea trifida]